MKTYNQLKKIIKKLRNKTPKDSTDDSDTIENNNVLKRKFSFLRTYSCRKSLKKSKYRNSVDVADLKHLKEDSDSTDRDRYSDNILCDKRRINSVKLQKPVRIINNDLEIDFNCKMLSDNNLLPTNETEKQPEYCQIEKPIGLSKSTSINGNIREKRKNVNPNCQSKTMRSTKSKSHHLSNKSETTITQIQILLRRIFNCPDHFYLILSYVITIFLLFSTAYVAYQVYKLECNIIKHFNKGSIPSVSAAIDNSLKLEMTEARQSLISQIERMTLLMKSIQHKIS